MLLPVDVPLARWEGCVYVIFYFTIRRNQKPTAAKAIIEAVGFL